MIRSHLVEAFTSTPWMLEAEVYDRLASLLQAHIAGEKAAWREQGAAPLAFFDLDEEPIPEDINDCLMDGHALIAVRGVLAPHADQVNGSCQPRGRSYESIAELIAACGERDEVRDIVLRLETPGGAAVGAQELYDAIVASSKPVHAWIDGYCFSAGYYLAAACATITASSRSANLGSIGVIAATWDTSAASEKHGYRRIIARCGEYKALGQDGEHYDDKAVGELQRGVDAYGAAFHDAVIAGRALSEEQAALVLNGRTFLAAQALELGLLDEISTLTTLLASLGSQSHKDATMSLFAKTDKTATPEKAAGLSKADYAALAAQFPGHQARLAELDSEGLTSEAIAAALWQSEAESRTEATTQATEALQAAQTSHSEALAAKDTELDTLRAELAAARDFSASHQADPGSNAAAEAALGEPMSDARLRQEWQALSPETQTSHLSFESYTYNRRHGMEVAE